MPPPPKPVTTSAAVADMKPAAAEGVQPQQQQQQQQQQPPPPSSEQQLANEDKNSLRLGSALRKQRGLVISNTSPVSSVLYLEGGYFLIALVNKFGEGEIRACKFGSPNKSR